METSEKLLCNDLPLVLTKIISSFLEANVQYSSILEIAGSIHIYSDGEKLISFIIDEELSKSNNQRAIQYPAISNRAQFSQLPLQQNQQIRQNFALHNMQLLERQRTPRKIGGMNNVGNRTSPMANMPRSSPSGARMPSNHSPGMNIVRQSSGGRMLLNHTTSSSPMQSRTLIRNNSTPKQSPSLNKQMQRRTPSQSPSSTVRPAPNTPSSRTSSVSSISLPPPEEEVILSDDDEPQIVETSSTTKIMTPYAQSSQNNTARRNLGQSPEFNPSSQAVGVSNIVVASSEVNVNPTITNVTSLSTNTTSLNALEDTLGPLESNEQDTQTSLTVSVPVKVETSSSEMAPSASSFADVKIAQSSSNNMSCNTVAIVASPSKRDTATCVTNFVDSGGHCGTFETIRLEAIPKKEPLDDNSNKESEDAKKGSTSNVSKSLSEPLFKKIRPSIQDLMAKSSPSRQVRLKKNLKNPNKPQGLRSVMSPNAMKFKRNYKMLPSGPEGVTLFPCQVCGLVLRSKPSHLAHMNARHTKKKTYRCNICNHMVFSSSALSNHLRRSHSVALKQGLVSTFENDETPQNSDSNQKCNDFQDGVERMDTIAEDNTDNHFENVLSNDQSTGQDQANYYTDPDWVPGPDDWTD